MARDRDHLDVAARTRAHAEALLATWHGYDVQPVHLDRVLCGSTWDGAAHCSLLEGHQGFHRGPLLGTDHVATW